MKLPDIYGLMILQSFLNIDKDSERKDTIDRFEKAWLIDNSIAIRILFYLRDCRGGKGLQLLIDLLLIVVKY